MGVASCVSTKRDKLGSGLILPSPDNGPGLRGVHFIWGALAYVGYGLLWIFHFPVFLCVCVSFCLSLLQGSVICRQNNSSRSLDVQVLYLVGQWPEMVRPLGGAMCLPLLKWLAMVTKGTGCRQTSKHQEETLEQVGSPQCVLNVILGRDGMRCRGE